MRVALGGAAADAVALDEPVSAVRDGCPPARRVRIGLPPEEVGFNGGLVVWGGRLLTVYRAPWAGADCHIREVDPETGEVGPRVTLNLKHPRAGYGREDPRFFLFRGSLHVAFAGVEGTRGPTSQLYARLRDDLKVERVFYPHYEMRRSWEKNWQFFQSGGELFAVYSISPHVVLHVIDDRAYPFTRQHTPHGWSGGHLRGGAQPVRVNDQFYSFFHGVKDVGRRRYNVGLYRFSVKPPFGVTDMTPDPLVWGDNVIFPCGAVKVKGDWLVSCGVNDAAVEILTWPDADVSRLLSRPAAAPRAGCAIQSR